jgi:hypothetical protein
VYGREYEDRELRFEPSGGLLNASLVMRDKETDTFWSIMTGDALSGELKGTALVELPYGEKVRFGEWVERYPDTVVLTVKGEAHDDENPYVEYFASGEGFHDAVATDERLETKAAIFSFRAHGRAYAVPLDALSGGATFDLGEERIFFYRPEGADLIRSTDAFRSATGSFALRGDAWVHEPDGARFDPETGAFSGGIPPEPLGGFDTFWYIWSLNHPDTEVLGNAVAP